MQACKYKGLILAPLFVIAATITTFGQQSVFECNAKLYLCQYNLGAPTTINEVEVIGTGNAVFNLLIQHNIVHNSSGYNRHDNLIYGFDPGARIVYRLFSDGTFTNMGTPAGVTQGGLVAGDVDSTGLYNLTGNSGILHKIDVTGTTATLVSSVNLNYITPGFSGNPGLLDVAFHPETQVLYSFDVNQNRLVTINTQNGDVEVIGQPQPYYPMGALFFDAFGVLYGYGSDQLYRIEIPSGVVRWVANGPQSGARDGCSCPYTISLNKEVVPRNACSGDTVEYVFTIANQTGTTVSGVDLIDHLPLHLTITQVLNTLGGTIQPGTGVGTQQLRINDMVLSNPSNEVVIKAVISSTLFGGVYLKNQAFLTSLSVVTTDTILSNDPNTPQSEDSTSLWVYPKTRNQALINTTGITCYGDSLILNGTLSLNITYQWFHPDGSLLSTANSAQINGFYYSDTGWYHVVALENNCTVIKDSIYIRPAGCGNSFRCDGRFYLARSDTGQNSLLQRLQYPSALSITPERSYPTRIFALGYNRVDNLLYGLEPDSNRILRLYRDGKWTRLPRPAGLAPVSGGFEAGDLDAGGYLYVTGSAGSLARIRVMDRQATLEHQVALSYTSGTGTPFLRDIAFHPHSGVLYGLDQGTSRMATINTNTGAVTLFGPLHSAVTIEALFFNAFGDLYGFGGNTLYKIDIQTGDINAIGSATQTGTLDGCSCPYGVAARLSAIPRQACPGDTITFTLEFVNNTGQNLPFATVHLPFDNRLQITSVSHSLNGSSPGNTGPGTSLFRRQQFTLPTGISTVVIRTTTLPGYMGGASMSQQAILTIFGYLAGDTIFSNDTMTIPWPDPTVITIHPKHNTIVDTSGCAGLQVWSAGQWQSTSGTYRDTLANQFSCDSIVTTNLTIYPVYTDTIPIAICQGGSYFAGGAWQTTDGFYTDSFSTILGCDSVRVIQLSIVNILYDNRVVSICDGQQYYAGGAWQSTTGVYYDTLLSSQGCDSIIITDLSVVNQVFSNDTFNLCIGDSIYVAGGWQTTSGTYSDTLLSGAGCDSIATTLLIFSAQVSTQTNLSICAGDSIFAGGTWQKVSGYYVDTLLSSAGCDSIITTVLTVYPVFADTVMVSICTGDSVYAGGAWRTASGEFTDYYVTINSCDSTVTTFLAVNDTVRSYQQIFICPGDSVWFAGDWRKQQGSYFFQGTTSFGCDSISEMALVYHPVPAPNLGNDTSFCVGDTLVLQPGSFTSYQWENGSTLPQREVLMSGTYRITVTDSFGCRGYDSVSITVYPIPSMSLGGDRTLCPGSTVTVTVQVPGASYLWHNGDTSNSYTSSGPEIIWVEATVNGCATRDSIIIDTFPVIPVVSPPDTTLCLDGVYTVDISQPQGISYSWTDGYTGPVRNLTEPGYYSFRVTDQNGCNGNGSVSLYKHYCPPTIYFPSAFTPNGDGRNDLFFVQSTQTVIEYIAIYNRWGEQVFFTTDPGTTWDGTHNGIPSPIGVYVVVVEYRDELGTVLQRKGNLTLIR
jgi:gliding motility-associated-like protein/uncharacterized repeat protein (TIGR01451 family)